jgi:hypothetical protein
VSKPCEDYLKITHSFEKPLQGVFERHTYTGRNITTGISRLVFFAKLP